jgi:hypothetical protein
MSEAARVVGVGSWGKGWKKDVRKRAAREVGSSGGFIHQLGGVTR